MSSSNREHSTLSFIYGTAWKNESTTDLVLAALEAGFRAIDTANQLIHYDEARVGEALRVAASRGIGRERLFLQTKFTPMNGQDSRLPYDPQAPLATQVKQSFESSLAHLHTDYLDSYVLHGPHYRRGLEQEDWEVWGAMEALYEAGRTKMIGVSNVSLDQLTLLYEQATHKPMVVQNRCYAAFGWDRDIRAFCRDQGIAYQVFSLLTANREVFVEPNVLAMAAKYGTGLAQIVFRFAMQIGMVPLTGTSNPQHMAADLQCDRFSLSEDELRRIESIGMS